MSGTAEGSWVGFPPVLKEGTGNPEAQKYGKLWALEEYRASTNGESLVPYFMEVANPPDAAFVIDFGCGRGRVGLALHQQGLNVIMIDIVRNSLDEDVREALTATPPMFKFIKLDLENPLGITADYGICLDVLEHIPPGSLQVTVNNILKAAKHILFTISVVADTRSHLIGEPLHLTVQKHDWWLKMFMSLGCTIHWAHEEHHRSVIFLSTRGHGDGKHYTMPDNPEMWKYLQMWEQPKYRQTSPGERLAQRFFKQAEPRNGAEIIDFGCGTGRGALALVIVGRIGGINVKVTMTDIVRNCLDPEIRAALKTQEGILKFIRADLEHPLPFAAEYGYCCDVLEHIPPDKVDLVLNHVLRAAKHVFFSVSTIDDNCGKLVGKPLHLSVHPFEWWLNKFNQRGCVVHWSENGDGHCLFYVSGWVTGYEIVDAGIVNTELDQIRENVRQNCSDGWGQISPHMTNDFEAMILGGGPSLNQHLEEIKRLRSEGVKLITINGSYNWAVENGLVPSAQVMVDARQFNSRFTKPVVENCKYLLASQCHPDAFIDLPKDNTLLWHTRMSDIKDILDETYGEGKWWHVPGGSTVLLRVIPLMRTLGYKRFHLFGCDSCLDEGKAHHAYSQPENDSDIVLPVRCHPTGRIFWCHPWMIAQATEFIGLIAIFGNEMELQVHGDGLLAHILETGASLEEADPTKDVLRMGECNHCGWCCQYLGSGHTKMKLALDPEQQEDRKYLEIRGFQVISEEMAEIETLWYAPCPAHKDDRCSVWEDRPYSCKTYPIRPAQIIRSPCSYWFEYGDIRVGGDASPYPWKGTRREFQKMWDEQVPSGVVLLGMGKKPLTEGGEDGSGSMGDLCAGKTEDR